MSLGMTEIILILLAVVILFGGKKIPELARALGKASSEFKKAKEAVTNEVIEIKAAAENEVKELDKAVNAEAVTETGETKK